MNYAGQPSEPGDGDTSIPMDIDEPHASSRPGLTAGRQSDPILSDIEATTNLMDPASSDFPGVSFNPVDNEDLEVQETMNTGTLPVPHNLPVLGPAHCAPPAESASSEPPFTFLLPTATYSPHQQIVPDGMSSRSPSIAKNHHGTNYDLFPSLQTAAQSFAYMPTEGPFPEAPEPVPLRNIGVLRPQAVDDQAQRRDTTLGRESNASFPWLHQNSTQAQPSLGTFVSATESSADDIKFFTSNCPPESKSPPRTGSASLNIFTAPVPEAPEPPDDSKPAPEIPKTDIKKIVLGSTSKASVTGAKLESQDDTPADKKKRKMYRGKREPSDRPRKGPSLNLFAKAGRELLSGKRELSEFLPAEDALFLASSFWIFTTDQLQAVLDGKDAEPAKAESQAAQPSLIQDQLITSIAVNELVGPKTTETAEVKNQTDDAAETEKGAYDVNAPVNDGAVAEGPESTEDPRKDIAVGMEQTAAVGSLAEVYTASSEDLMEQAMQIMRETQNPESMQLSEPMASPVTAEQLELAKAKVDEWRDMLKGSCKKDRPMEEMFPLSGPVRVLFPVPALNFLVSVGIDTLWKYFSAKKNENSVLVSLMDDWRILCGLEKEVSYYSISKFFAGITSRIENALSTVPCIAPKTRIWMADSINSMTGAARDFLIFRQGIVSVDAFLAVKTKELSVELQNWRLEKGMEPLKGSGKVAMISAWKTQCKEILELAGNNGKINKKVQEQMKDKPIEFEVLEIPVRKVSSSDEPQKRKRQKKTVPSEKSVEAASDSKAFLSKTLGSEAAKLLESVSVSTAKELFELTEMAPLFEAMVGSGVIADTSAGQKKCEEWRQKLKTSLDDKAKQASPPPPQTKSDEDAVVIKPTTSRSKPKGSGSDPYDALSSQTKLFLRSVGVETAEEFLTARSSDLSEQFKVWRKANGIPELKGLGAIASVSGWKAIVRKKAIDLGLTELSIMEPSAKGSRSTSDIVAAATKSRPSRKPSPKGFLQENAAWDIAEGVGNLLDTDGRRVFAVQSQDGTGEDLYISYKGLRPLDSASESVEKVELASESSEMMKTARPCWILPDVPLTMSSNVTEGKLDTSASFSIGGRGGGLIDLTRYGCSPIRSQDLEPLKRQILAFVTDGSAVEQSALENGSKRNENIIVRKVGFDKFQYFLYVGKPIEKGQTVVIDFPTLESVFATDKYQDSAFELMHKIEEALRVIPCSDQKKLLVWLCDQVLPSTDYSETMESGDKTIDLFQAACRRRCRLQWVASRLQTSIGKKAIGADVERQSLLSFRKTSIDKEDYWGKLSKKQQLCFASVMEEQLKLEIAYVVELDRTYGVDQRSKWCKRAHSLADAMVNTIVTNYVLETGASPFQSIKNVLDDAIKVTESAEKNDIDEFTFHLSTGLTVARLTKQIRRQYAEALVLCNETEYDIPAQSSMVVVASAKDTLGGSKKAMMLRPAEFEHGDAALSVAWYSKLFWEITVSAVKAFSCCLGKTLADELKLRDLLSQIKISRSDLGDVPTPGPFSYKQILPVPSSHRGSDINSFPFFLGIVWPALRKHGWRLIAGSTPSELLFSGPSGQRVSSGYAKRQRDRKRMQIEEEANQAGLGVAHKKTKRLLAATAQKKHSVNELPDRQYVVRAYLEQFKTFIVNRMSSTHGLDPTLSESKMNELLGAIEECFSSLIPIFGEATNASTPERSRPADTQHNMSFSQFLFAMCHVLRSSDLPQEEADDSLRFLQEMLKFAADNQKKLFEPNSLPPEEEYVEDPYVASFLEQKLNALKPKSADNEDDGKEEDDDVDELVRDEDKPNITDFIVVVLQQAKPFRATEEDVRKKNGRVRLGAPGIVCRHCLGAKHEGRYFFSTVESLTACYTVLEKHSLKCKATPEEVKKQLAVARSKHQAQRKNLKAGLQQKFFTNLWRRLKGSKLSGANVVPAEGDHTSLAAPKKPTSRSASDTFIGKDFTDYLKVLDRLRTELTSEDSTVDREIEVALGRYYGCLDYAGRVYMTPSMPKHFSPEWLLAKVAPKNYHKHPRKRYVG